jgi:hypothetical protein
MHIPAAVYMGMSGFESMFIGVIARPQVRQRVVPEGIQCLEI